MDASLVLVLVGSLGVFAMTFAFPLIALCLQAKSNKDRKLNLNFRNLPCIIEVTPQSEKITSLAVIIPAHNESSKISSTINSIKVAEQFHCSQKINLQIFVAADGCSDSTAQIAREHGALVFEQKEKQGKWRTLKNLFNFSQDLSANRNFEWIGIVDAGAIWPENLISKIFKDLSDTTLVGIAPSYCNLKAKLPEKISWLLESSLKSLENLSGGPVSVHGATVFYRSFALKNAFEFLGQTNWTNDDVVIPLAIRSIENNSKILYRKDIKIIDRDDADHKQEKARRKRLVKGNLQWISNLWLRVLQNNPIVACLALRRICRVLWAYWLIALATACLAYILSLASINLEIFSAVFIFGIFLLLSLLGRSKQIITVIAASLLSPIYFLFFMREESSWK